MISKPAFRLIFVTVIILSVTSTSAQNKTDEVGAYVDSVDKSKQLLGVVLASYKGKIVFEKAYGFASEELNVPSQINTRFAIASVTKPMTRVITLKLVEEGKMQLNDTIGKWVKGFPGGDKITIEMLLDHKSGLPHRITRPEEETAPYTAADMLEKAKQAVLEFEPGSKESYSSLGYSVLTGILEIISGKSYSELLDHYVFQPAGMNSSMDSRSDTIIPYRSTEYRLAPGRLIPAPPQDYSFIVGAGSVYSTAHDVYLFGDAVVKGKYGEAVKKALVDSSGRFRENGSSYSRCFVLFDTKKDYGFILVSNVLSGANDLLIRDIPKILEDQKISPPPLPHFNFIQVPVSKLQEYVGAYKFPRFTNHITMDKGKIISGDSQIFPIGEDRFFRLADYATLTFTRNSSGKIDGLKWEGLTTTFMGVRQ
ncbi:MAG: hypothetical protein C5B52_03160 [Bacteroidetes bacterium]|nr:MAG: hypothetical protein C5B52_03160 [Bacteroidota bacterium]